MIEEEIISISKKIAELKLARDAHQLATLIADDYIGVDPSGVLIDKAISVGR